jgi:uncharacterized membrane protein
MNAFEILLMIISVIVVAILVIPILIWLWTYVFAHAIVSVLKEEIFNNSKLKKHVEKK